MHVNTFLLADSRFPCGGHAHSGGLEAAAGAGRVVDVRSLGDFLYGRLATAGLVAAAIAAAAALHPGEVDGWRLDAEADARTASPALRQASRQLGRGLVRGARASWGDVVPGWLPGTSRPSSVASAGSRAGAAPHHPVALGAIGAAVGLGAADTARIAAHGSVAGPATAAVRLLGLDPLAVAAVVARLAPAMEDVVDEAVAAGAGEVADLPSPSAPLLDLGAEQHALQEVRLFAS